MQKLNFICIAAMNDASYHSVHATGFTGSLYVRGERLPQRRDDPGHLHALHAHFLSHRRRTVQGEAVQVH